MSAESANPAPLQHLLAAAGARARSLDHTYVGTEHLLLALLDDDDRATLSLFRELGLEAGSVERLTEDTVRRGRPGTELGHTPPLTTRAKKILAYGADAARYLGADVLKPAFLLPAMAAEAKGIAGQVLAAHGIDGAAAITALARVLGLPLPEAPWDLAVPHHAAEPAQASPPPVPHFPELHALQADLPRELSAAAAFALVADLSIVDADTVAEILASLDMLHRAWGGAGLVIESHSVGTAAAEGVTA